jgi:hypothetical protein
MRCTSPQRKFLPKPLVLLFGQVVPLAVCCEGAIGDCTRFGVFSADAFVALGSDSSISGEAFTLEVFDVLGPTCLPWHGENFFYGMVNPLHDYFSFDPLYRQGPVPLASALFFLSCDCGK